MTTSLRQTAADHTLTPHRLEQLIHEHNQQRRPRLDRLWRYFRNPIHPQRAAALNQDDYQLAQEQGLPARLTEPDRQHPPRERVIENDIAWRIHTLVDFMFGKPVVIQSLAPRAERAAIIQPFLRHVLQRNGGTSFFQDMAMLGAIYGYIDVLVHVDPNPPTDNPADRIRLELVEAPRALPAIASDDYRKLDAYALHVHQPNHANHNTPLLTRMRNRVLGQRIAPRATLERTSVWTADTVRQYQATTSPFGPPRQLVSEQVNTLGRIPVVHIQNLAQPFYYEGLSEVEPLVPLQDELNTRLSDRANRVTFQSFKMYLGKGIEQFTERPVGPGQMWSTENTEASIQEFGGDGHSPSEETHIREIREAMDKASGVTPVAAGIIGGRVGNLTSAVALRTVLMGLIARTEKKRITYGAGLEQLCDLVLHAADVHDLLPNTQDERRVRIDWPHPLPLSEEEQLRNARMKLDLGVPQHQVLAELGYAECGHDG